MNLIMCSALWDNLFWDPRGTASLLRKLHVWRATLFFFRTKTKLLLTEAKGGQTENVQNFTNNYTRKHASDQAPVSICSFLEFLRYSFVDFRVKVKVKVKLEDKRIKWVRLFYSIEQTLDTAVCFWRIFKMDLFLVNMEFKTKTKL